MYVKLLNGQPDRFPYTLGNLRRDNPGTSFPAVIGEEVLSDFDVYPVATTPAPAFDSKTQRVSQYVESINGVWTQAWQTNPLPEDQASANVRAERNQLLADCDWTQLPDAPVDAATWATYRQSLRDVSGQPGFPWNVQWPTEP